MRNIILSRANSVSLRRVSGLTIIGKRTGLASYYMKINILFQRSSDFN